MKDKKTTFLGFLRPDGAVGVRNHVVIMPTVYCANETAKLIARNADHVVALTHPFGCDEPGPELHYQGQVINNLVGIGENPNVTGVLVLGLGCEVLQTSDLMKRFAASKKTVKSLVIQQEGGTLETVRKGTDIVKAMLGEVKTFQRQEFDLSRLTIAVDCGGSDATSGLAANPAVGVAVDMLIKAGGTAIFTEPGEMIGTEHILARRAVNDDVRDRIYRMVANEEKRWKALDIQPRWMSPGNIAGGLTTIEEKSLGAIQKGGTSPVCGVLENSLRALEKPWRAGLFLQDGTGADVHGVTHMVAAGAQVVIFTTGKGSTVGHAVAPVIKVTGNPQTYAGMTDDMDINAGKIISGEESIRQVGERIFDKIIRTASGEESRSESLGYRDFQIYGPNPVIDKSLGIKERL
ncbi:MAG: UxaA family hydrolase [Candidatus Aminicenantes bacterium]|nr:UxaA family hydrolase [Candidatus Aminicenantes bacterium]